MSEHDEKCQRCGEDGEDRRTIWMAAMYAMDETGLPLEQVRITGKYAKQTGEETLTGFLKLKVPVFTEEPDAQDREHRFFTLRVCKDCRAEWMLAIRHWFLEKNNPPLSLMEEASSKVRPGMIQMDGAVPVRVFGATVSVGRSAKREPDCPLAGHSGTTLRCSECDQLAKDDAERIEGWNRR